MQGAQRIRQPALQRISGSVTISSSGVPARFKSMPDDFAIEAREVFVQRFAGIFFQMGARQLDGNALVAHKEANRAALHDRDLVLADLVALG